MGLFELTDEERTMLGDDAQDSLVCRHSDTASSDMWGPHVSLHERSRVTSPHGQSRAGES